MTTVRCSEEWTVQDWFPKGHKIMDVAPECNFKTLRGAWLAVCIASGNDYFGQPVQQGRVLIVDEETGLPSLEKPLNRFAMGMGFEGYKELPIDVETEMDFKFGRKTALNNLLQIVGSKDYRLLRLDSVLAMLPGGRQGMGENDSSSGIAIRDDLNALLKTVDLISISAHSKKEIADIDWESIKQRELQSVVRGHGSIVGEGSDTGLIIKKLSEHPNPARFVMTAKARRMAIPMSGRDTYVEMQEQSYGQGWAKLVEIDKIVEPPTQVTMELYKMFLREPDLLHSQSKIRYLTSIAILSEVRSGLSMLLEHSVISNSDKEFHYKLNKECADSEYLELLQVKKGE